MPQFIPSLAHPVGLDQFARDYLEAMEWTDADRLIEDARRLVNDEPEAMERTDDVNRDRVAALILSMGFSAALIENTRNDCAEFQELNAADLALYEEKTGQSGGVDFWLTRNGHGAGFWDRGLGELGDRLSEAAKLCGSLDVYRGDDGLIYTHE